MKGKLRKLLKDESGQSFVELALILPILLLLLTVPVDFFRYINTKNILSSAASECIGQLNYGDIPSGNAKIKQTMIAYYGDRLDSSKVVVEFNIEGLDKKDYNYYVYSSDLADPDPDNYGFQFDPRDSHYRVQEIQVQLSYEMEPITFWGALFLGPSFTVRTPEFTRSVYAGGYTP